jgi:arylsulfatase
VLTVDGKPLSRQTIPHSIPIIMTVDESFDVGIDTRSTVDNSYELPFRFTGTINKLTFKLGPSQLGAADQKAIQERLAAANN